MKNFRIRQGAQAWEVNNTFNELVEYIEELTKEIAKLKSNKEVQSNGSQKEEPDVTKDAESRDAAGSTSVPKRQVNRSNKK